MRYKSEKLPYEVLVDSGADMSLFDWEIGDALGIEIKRGIPCEVLGVGGGISVYYLHTVILVVGGMSYKARVGFADNPSGQMIPYGIVGQRGFFDKFVVSFDLRKEEITLKPRK